MNLLKNIIDVISVYSIPFILFVIPLYAYLKKVRVYETFTSGAKEGFQTAVEIIPYLTAMLVAVGIFRSSGAMDFLVKLLNPIASIFKIPAEVLPMGIMRSLSGGGATGLLTELYQVYGPDSLIGRMGSVAMGSTETTFYTLAVYYGAVKVSNVRHSLSVGLLCDALSLVYAAIVTHIAF